MCVLEIKGIIGFNGIQILEFVFQVLRLRVSFLLPRLSEEVGYKSLLAGEE